MDQAFLRRLDRYRAGVDVNKYDPDNIFHHHQNIRPRSQPLGPKLV